jgi:hypothetical protein
MNDAKTSFSTEIFAGAIISVVLYLAPLRYAINGSALLEINNALQCMHECQKRDLFDLDTKLMTSEGPVYKQ